MVKVAFTDISLIAHGSEMSRVFRIFEELKAAAVGNLVLINGVTYWGTDFSTDEILDVLQGQAVYHYISVSFAQGKVDIPLQVARANPADKYVECRPDVSKICESTVRFEFSLPLDCSQDPPLRIAALGYPEDIDRDLSASEMLMTSVADAGRIGRNHRKLDVLISNMPPAEELSEPPEFGRGITAGPWTPYKLMKTLEQQTRPSLHIYPNYVRQSRVSRDDSGRIVQRWEGVPSDGCVLIWDSETNDFCDEVRV